MPVGLSPEAFLSGDGSWTGRAAGEDGQVNPNFIFGYPPDWIEDPNPTKWTWQKETWTAPTVRGAIEISTRKMYADLSENVGGLEELEFSLPDVSETGTSVRHDPRIAEIFPQIGGYNYENFLQEPLTLHVPDKDYYSQVSWNQNLCKRINGAGGACNIIVYRDNNHSLRASPHSWFSPKDTPDGYPIMVKNAAAAFGLTMSQKESSE